VSFDIDANGILNVSAKDKGSGKEQKIVIQSSSGLSKDEVEKMRKDAEAHAAEDEARRALVESRNKAEQVSYDIEKLLKEHGDKVPAEVRSRIEEKKKAVDSAKAGEDPKAIDTAVEELLTASQEIARKMYEDSAKAGQPTEPPPRGGVEEPAAAKKDDDVIDVDFKK
jgi:molecular chaperone DnaK